MNPRQHSLFPGFAGVALADILANSVAIIIIMIVVTIFIKHEQEQEQLEQVEDVSVLLSREIAHSVVMNTLPNSPPTRLHDYNTSPLDRNPQHARMPIIELHDGYIQNYYTGKRIPRHELLLQNNRFDKYIRSLTKAQLLRMRIDIYSIRLFYIVMSILKSHNHSPRHWHFSAGSDKQKKSRSEGNDIAQEGNFDDKDDPDETDEKNNSEKQSGNNIADTSDNFDQTLKELTDENQSMIPQQATLLSTPIGDENYPYNDLAFDTGNGTSEITEPTDLPGSGEKKNPTQKESDLVFNALAQMIKENMSGSKSRQRKQTTLSRFRSADPNSTDLQSRKEQISLFSKHPVVDFKTILPALFDFMQEVQNASDNGTDTSKLANYNFNRDILQRISNLSLVFSQEEKEFFARLSAAVQNIPEQKKATLFVNTQTDTSITGRILSAAVNQRIQNAALINDPNQSDFYDLPAEIEITSRLSLYPEIYQGLRLPLLEDMLILMPPQQASPETFRWRVVTLVSPMLDDFVTAFIYAAVDEDNLLIPSAENALKISNLRIVTDYRILPFRQERWQILFYGLITALILLGVLRRGRKTA